MKCHDFRCDREANYVFVTAKQPYAFCHQCAYDGTPRQRHLQRSPCYPADSDEALAVLVAHKFILPG